MKPPCCFILHFNKTGDVALSIHVFFMWIRLHLKVNSTKLYALCRPYYKHLYRQNKAVQVVLIKLLRTCKNVSGFSFLGYRIFNSNGWFFFVQFEQPFKSMLSTVKKLEYFVKYVCRQTYTYILIQNFVCNLFTMRVYWPLAMGLPTRTQNSKLKIWKIKFCTSLRTYFHDFATLSSSHQL